MRYFELNTNFFSESTMANLQASMIVIYILLHITPLIATNSNCDPSHPSSCDDCVCWDTIPAAIGDYTLNGIKIVLIELWNNFFTSSLVWEWTFLYGVMLYSSKCFFERLYYPQLINAYGGMKSDSTLTENLKIKARSLTAGSKFISFFAALSCVIRCQLLLRTDKMSDDNIWVSMYIPTPPEIDQLMDSLLGYFVVDTIYLLLYRRRWMYIVHHQVAFVGMLFSTYSLLRIFPICIFFLWNVYIFRYHHLEIIRNGSTYWNTYLLHC